MHVKRTLVLDGPEGDVREALRAYWSGEGYVEERAEPRAFIFHRPGGFAAALTSRIERIPASVVIRLGGGRPGDGGSARTIVTVSWRLLSRLRLVTRLDRLFVELEIEGLRDYVASGRRPAVAERLHPVRSPVSTAVTVNLVMSIVLVGAVGLVGGLGFLATAAVAVSVGMINVISILGFADIVVEGMERVRPSVEAGNGIG